ncbi:MAG TPA: type I methionyl aminopeptidase, partial [Gemmatimonadaceae bacterium]
MVQLKSPREIETMAVGGKILAATHQRVREAVRAGVTTMDLDRVAEDFIRSHEGATPSFKGLYDFPASICASIDEEIVHGIPSPKRVLKDGDIISVDIGVFYGGLHTDSANTWPVGRIDEKTAKLLRVTQQALEAGLSAATVGNYVGDIGYAIETVVLKGGFAVVRELVGHGVGHMMHEEPQVPNHGKPRRGMRLV